MCCRLSGRWLKSKLDEPFLHADTSKNLVKLLPLLFLATVVVPAQVPRIAMIEYYGLRKVAPEKVGKALNVKPGDPLPPSKGATEDQLDKIPGVVRSRIEAVCCEDDGIVLFVGIEERGARNFPFRDPPSGDPLLPQDIVDTYKKFREIVEQAARDGRTAEDLRSGHSLMADPDARALQQRFTILAEIHLLKLREVLRSSANDEHRAIAAYVIGYAPLKRLVVDDLQVAIQDPDDGVRHNALRALTAISVLAARDPALGIKISPTWFVEMLNSIVWSDRNKAVMALIGLTDNRSSDILNQIRERALPSVVEMARWNSLPHAIGAYTLVGRLAGLSETEIQDTWTKGEREKVIAGVLKPNRRR